MDGLMDRQKTIPMIPSQLCRGELTLEHHLLFSANKNFKNCRFLKNNKHGMIFHDSHEISFLISFEN